MQHRTQRGAALLTAMVIVTLVATLAGSMVWQQWRAVQVEAAERARVQSQWILDGAIDWARLILREDARTGGVDHLGEPWALPLAEAKLSTFLAADRENTDDAPDAFLSGVITDAQSRFNLRNLVEPGANSTAEAQALAELFELAGASADAAARVVAGLRDAAPARAPVTDGNAGTGTKTETGTTAPQTARSADPPLMPERIDQLAWLGLDAETLQRITPYVTLLPVRTPINANTASKEVLAAVIPGMDLAGAERLVQLRQRNPLRQLTEITNLLPQAQRKNVDQGTVDFKSRYFVVRGRLRLQDRVVEERALVERRQLEIVLLRRERVTALDSVAQ
ncbi:MAG: type II secretion system minor pseudopilin GspK [Methylibium sp.]|uniref:type II secretion system minor pseudopilin GspK n=1 Tax=Methylibium sp. TaxID=2067992 RepID=UPI0017D0D5A1|nr:type II secretion system minor pseudopilin GspK [Methylibium sp.]MBA3599440.1 type II secretion system minor pseudopilin GspK [Methylibium sp.]